MSRELSKVHFFGNRHKPAILLIHGMGFYWEKCFGNMLPVLEKRYYCIVPELAGHHNTLKNEIINIEAIAENIVKECIEHGVSEFKIVYGCSFGASVAAEIASEQEIPVRTMVLDGAEFVDLKWQKIISAFIMAMQFRRLAKGKHMNAYVRGQLGYSGRDEISIFQRLMCEKISFKVLFRTAYACYKYRIETKKTITSNVLCVHGGKENFSEESFLIIKEKTSGNVSKEVFDSLGHAEALSCFPEKLVDIFIGEETEKAI